MKAFGITILEMEKDSKGILMAILTLASSNMDELTEKESTLGRMVKYLTENGIKA